MIALFAVAALQAAAPAPDYQGFVRNSQVAYDNARDRAQAQQLAEDRRRRELAEQRASQHVGELIQAHQCAEAFNFALANGYLGLAKLAKEVCP